MADLSTIQMAPEDIAEMDRLADEITKVGRRLGRLQYGMNADIKKALIDGRLPMDAQVRITDKYQAKRAALETELARLTAERTPLWQQYQTARQAALGY